MPTRAQNTGVLDNSVRARVCTDSVSLSLPSMMQGRGSDEVGGWADFPLKPASKDAFEVRDGVGGLLRVWIGRFRAGRIFLRICCVLTTVFLMV